MHIFNPLSTPSTSTGLFRSLSLQGRWLSAALNTAIIMGLYEFYDYGRGLIPRNGPVALQHAHEVWNWEVRHGIFVEPDWQQFWLTKVHMLAGLRFTPARVTELLNTGYLYIHFLGTIAFLIWLFLFRRQIFPYVRNIFFVTTAIALVVYILYPLAPPRLTPNLLYYHRHYIFIDTVRLVIDPRLQTSQIGYNPYAAMPSLHFGWALIIGCTLAATLRFWPLRVLCLGYPFFMLAVIVISGNHFFADAIGSAVVVAVATAAVTLWMAWRKQLPWRLAAPSQTA